MHRYFFSLGRNPTLSVAEIHTVLINKHVMYQIVILSKEIFVISTTIPLHPADLMQTLGGTIKIGEAFDEIGFDQSSKKFDQITESDYFLKHFISEKTSSKLHIGISLYDAGTTEQLLDSLENLLPSLNQNLKDHLKEKGVRVGFVQQRERILSSVSVAKNKLLRNGVEIVLIATKDKVIIGKTIVVQEFEQFSFRDFQRPFKDKRSGIMPPKLARMMINLAGLEKGDTLLDPFCGSGTILQEAIVLEYKNIISTDISEKAIQDTKNNIDWLFSRLVGPPRTSYNLTIQQTDAEKISQAIKQNSIKGIITEPFLGPPLFKKSTPVHVQNTFKTLLVLYEQVFSEFKKILIPGGRVVIIFPVFEFENKYFFLEILEALKKLGFDQTEILPKKCLQYPDIKLTARNSIIYGSPHDFTQREILVFEKN